MKMCTLLLLMAAAFPIGLVAQFSGRHINADNAVLVPGKRFLYKETVYSPDTASAYYIVLSVQPNPLYRQTLIRYTYYLSLDSLQKEMVYTWEETLAVDNRRWYQIHPPRAGINEIHELLPFPEVPLKKKEGYQWKSTVVVMDGWDKLPKNTRIVSRYQLGADTTIEFGGQPLKGRFVRAISRSKFGVGDAAFVFVDSLGIIDIENKINGITTRMHMLEEL